MKLKIKLPDVKNLPGIILNTGLPVIVISLLYIAFYTYSKSAEFKTVREAAAMLEHVLMSLALILGGALLANTIPER
jgi:hypothetical protein